MKFIKTGTCQLLINDFAGCTSFWMECSRQYFIVMVCILPLICGYIINTNVFDFYYVKSIAIKLLLSVMLK